MWVLLTFVWCLNSSGESMAGEKESCITLYSIWKGSLLELHTYHITATCTCTSIIIVSRRDTLVLVRIIAHSRN